MTLRALIGNAMHSLRRNRLQSSLSLLGIVIGVFAVTLIVSMGLGLRAFVVGQIEVFGTNLLAINPAVPGIAERNALSSGINAVFLTSLKIDDLEAIRDQDYPYIVSMIGMKTGQGYVRSGNKEIQSLVIASSAGYGEIDRQATIAKGRWYTEDEDRSLRQVAVLGATVAEKLFGQRDPIGQKVKLKDVQLEIVGVLDERGSMFGIDFDTLVLVPLTLGEKRVIGADFVNEIDIKVSEEKYVAVAEEDIRRLLMKRHKIEDPDKIDFVVTTEQEVKEQLTTVTGAITLLLGFLAAISLLVGGIGIMNIMLVAVVERIHEVGLRKSVGARDSDIRLQFLAESVILTTTGGLIGGFLGTVMAFAAAAFARAAGYDVPYVISLGAFFSAAVVSAVVGIVFGLYPARKAARLDPIESLRYQ